MNLLEAKGPVAARLRQRKYAVLRQFGIPEGALPGSLVVTYRRCGKPTCHCASSGKGHPMWQLSFQADGKKYVQAIPQKWVDEVMPLVEQGREYKDAVAEVFAINARLLVLWLRQNKKPHRFARRKATSRPKTGADGSS